DREAALVVDRCLLAPLHDFGVRERDHLVLGALEDEQPLEDADLRRSQADSVRVDHQLLHPLDEPDEAVVELLHRPRLHLQGGVGVLADLRERNPAPRFAFRIELLVLYLAFDLRHAGGMYPRSDGAPPRDATRAEGTRGARRRSRDKPDAWRATAVAAPELP